MARIRTGRSFARSLRFFDPRPLFFSLDRTVLLFLPVVSRGSILCRRSLLFVRETKRKKYYMAEGGEGARREECCRIHGTKRDACEINLVIIDVRETDVESIRLLYMKYL